MPVFFFDRIRSGLSYKRVMINHLPDRLDLYATAEVGRALRGRIKLASLDRVLPLLESHEGELEIVLELDRDEDGTRYLAGSIQGRLVLQCQRCLEPLDYPLEVTFRLGLAHTQEEMQRLSDLYEPLSTGGPREPTVQWPWLCRTPSFDRLASLGECRSQAVPRAVAARSRSNSLRAPAYMRNDALGDHAR